MNDSNNSSLMPEELLRGFMSPGFRSNVTCIDGSRRMGHIQDEKLKTLILSRFRKVLHPFSQGCGKNLSLSGSVKEGG